MIKLFGASLGSGVAAMLAACLLPFVWTIFAKVAGGFRAKDNAEPREFLAQTTGIARRAHAAQSNSFETLPMFLAAVLLAIYCFVPQSIVNGLAWMYVLIRIGYGVAYIGNWPVLRSILWLLSMVVVMMLFIFALRVLGGF